jgi:hypothetical protein
MVAMVLATVVVASSDSTTAIDPLLLLLFVGSIGIARRGVRVVAFVVDSVTVGVVAVCAAAVVASVVSLRSSHSSG